MILILSFYIIKCTKTRKKGEQNMRILNKQEIVDIMIGCSILGTGGGGALKEGMDAVEKELAAGHEFKLLDFSEIKDDAYYTNPYLCGEVVPDDHVVELSGEELPDAVAALEQYMNVDFHGLISIEYGAGNTGVAMAAAAHMGKYMVDADAAGRAVPELQFSTYYVREQPIAPFAVSTVYGDAVIVQKVADDARAEALSRFMAVGSNGLVGMTDHPIRGDKLKTSVIPNALTFAEKVGAARRTAEENGADPIAAILTAGGGNLLFNGTVNDRTNWELKNGFTIGNIYLTDHANGDEIRIWYKNENMLCWKNNEVVLTCPDLICVVDTKTGMPITNPNCIPGMELSVLAFPCHPIWKETRALEILNPRFFGFDMDCKFL